MHTPMSPVLQLTEVDDLLRTMPPVASFETPSNEHYAWLGKASALVHRWDPIKAVARFDGFVTQLTRVWKLPFLSSGCSRCAHDASPNAS